MTDHLARATEMQQILDRVVADHTELSALADRLGPHLDRVATLCDYMGDWLEDRDMLLVEDEGRIDLPILGEDPLWEAVDNTARFLRRLLGACADGIAAELRSPEE